MQANTILSSTFLSRYMHPISAGNLIFIGLPGPHHLQEKSQTTHFFASGRSSAHQFAVNAPLRHLPICLKAYLIRFSSVSDQVFLLKSVRLATTAAATSVYLHKGLSLSAPGHALERDNPTSAPADLWGL